MLSDRDLSVLETQIESADSDAGLEGLQLLGWFLAHTRGPLQLTDPELELFDRFFTLPGQLTLLVKPERFQPTLFGLLVRGADGAMPRDASQNAFILPLPGRAGRSSAENGPQPSLMAPKSNRVAAPRPAARPLAAEQPALPQERETELESPAEPAKTLSPETPLDGNSLLEPPPDDASLDGPVDRPGEPAATADIRAARRRLKFQEARLFSDAPEPEPETLTERALPSNLTPVRSQIPQPPEEPDAAPRETAYQQFQDNTRPAPPPPAPTSSRLMLVLPLAALIGSVVGYVAYLQIPSPIIPLNARGVAQSVMVSWPPAETRSSVYAAIRVDDSAPVPLSPGEKAAGQLELSATPDMKIELITHNWLRDARGIVRFIKADNPQAAAVPAEQ
jgi:hypothetical protein